jgi:hypothetical protein
MKQEASRKEKRRLLIPICFRRDNPERKVGLSSPSLADTSAREEGSDEKGEAEC